MDNYQIDKSKHSNLLFIEIILNSAYFSKKVFLLIKLKANTDAEKIDIKRTKVPDFVKYI